MQLFAPGIGISPLCRTLMLLQKNLISFSLDLLSQVLLPWKKMLSTYSLWVKSYLKLKWWSKRPGMFLLCLISVEVDYLTGLMEDLVSCAKVLGFYITWHRHPHRHSDPGKAGLWLPGHCLETELNRETLCLGTTELQNVHGHIWAWDVLSQGICLGVEMGMGVTNGWTSGDHSVQPLCQARVT